MGVSGPAYNDRETFLLAEALRAASTTDRQQLAQLRGEVFRSLGTAFAEGRMSGVEFEVEFPKFWRLYRDSGVPTASAVDALFTAVDVFCGDPKLSEEGDLDEAGLREAVLKFLRQSPARRNSERSGDAGPGSDSQGS